MKSSSHSEADEPHRKPRFPTHAARSILSSTAGGLLIIVLVLYVLYVISRALPSFNPRTFNMPLSSAEGTDKDHPFSLPANVLVNSEHQPQQIY